MANFEHELCAANGCCNRATQAKVLEPTRETLFVCSEVCFVNHIDARKRPMTGGQNRTAATPSDDVPADDGEDDDNASAQASDNDSDIVIISPSRRVLVPPPDPSESSQRRRFDDQGDVSASADYDAEAENVDPLPELAGDDYDGPLSVAEYDSQTSDIQIIERPGRVPPGATVIDGADEDEASEQFLFYPNDVDKLENADEQDAEPADDDEDQQMIAAAASPTFLPTVIPMGVSDVYALFASPYSPVPASPGYAPPSPGYSPTDQGENSPAPNSPTVAFVDNDDDVNNVDPGPFSPGGAFAEYAPGPFSPGGVYAAPSPPEEEQDPRLFVQASIPSRVREENLNDDPNDEDYDYSAPIPPTPQVRGAVPDFIGGMRNTKKGFRLKEYLQSLDYVHPELRKFELTSKLMSTVISWLTGLPPAIMKEYFPVAFWIEQCMVGASEDTATPLVIIHWIIDKPRAWLAASPAAAKNLLDIEGALERIVGAMYELPDGALTETEFRISNLHAESTDPFPILRYGLPVDFPNKVSLFKPLAVASFIEEQLLMPGFEILPYFVRRGGYFFALNVDTIPGVPSSKLRMPVWSASEAEYHITNDSWQWTPQADSVFEQYQIINYRKPFTTLASDAILAAFRATIAAVSRGRSGHSTSMVRGGGTALLADDFFELVYGPSHAHKAQMFLQTEQFNVKKNPATARELRQYMQRGILTLVQKTLRERNILLPVTQVVYGQSAFVPWRVGDKLWHGTRSPKLASGEWVVKKGSFFSADDEMSARYAATARVEEGDPTPTLMCYKVVCDFPQKMVNFGYIPMNDQKPPEPGEEVWPLTTAPDMYDTTEAFEKVFHRCFGFVDGRYTPQANIITKVWGTGLIVNGLQSVGSVFEPSERHIRRKFFPAYYAPADASEQCRAGIEVVLAFPKRHLARDTRPAIDAVVKRISELREMSQEYRDAAGIVIPGAFLSTAYGFSDILAALYYTTLFNGDQIDFSVSPPYMTVMHPEIKASYSKIIPAEEIVSDEHLDVDEPTLAQQNRLFVMITFTRHESEGGKYSITHHKTAADPYDELPLPYDWAGRNSRKETCLLLGNSAAKRRIESVRLPLDSKIRFVDAIEVDTMFRQFMMKTVDIWREAIGTDEELIRALMDLLQEGMDVVPRPGGGLDIRRRTRAAQRFDQRLLFTHRDYVYLVQAPSDLRFGAGSIGVRYDENSRNYYHEDWRTVYGFAFNDELCSGARLNKS